MSYVSYSFVSCSTDSDSDENESFLDTTEKYDQIKTFLKNELENEELCKYCFWVYYKKVENIVPKSSIVKRKDFLKKAIPIYNKFLHAFSEYKLGNYTPFNTKLFELFYAEIKNLVESHGELSYTFPFAVASLHCDLVFALDICGGTLPSKADHHSKFNF